MEELKSVPYIVFEASEARSERHIKRLIIALVISILVGFATNLSWLYAWNQYDYAIEAETRTYIQDGEGLNIIGNANEVRNGASSQVHENQEGADSEKN